MKPLITYLSLAYRYFPSLEVVVVVVVVVVVSPF
jgi:hypothetical protein